jgi:RNA polymerase sigma-70 factor (ECF subfamily)
MAAGTLGRAGFAPAETPVADRPRPGIDAVYAEHFRYVWRCLRALGLDDGQVDDAIHDVFLVVQQKLPSFDGRAEVTTWLYAICIRVARRYRWAARKDAWRFSAIDDEPESSTVPPAVSQRDPEKAMERGERLSLARRALDRLEDDKREAFVLSQVEQMSAPEIAEITGVPLNTVYSRIRAAKLAFQAEISRLELVTRGRSR